MAPIEESPPGYVSVVHQGPLRPVLIWKAPYEYVVWNVMAAMVMCLMLTWRWLVPALLVHLCLIGLWWYDPHFLASLLEARKYRHFLGVD